MLDKQFDVRHLVVSTSCDCQVLTKYFHLGSSQEGITDSFNRRVLERGNQMKMVLECYCWAGEKALHN